MSLENGPKSPIVAPAQNDHEATLSSLVSSSQLRIDESSLSESSESISSETSLEEDPSFDDAMNILSKSVGARTWLYYKLSPLFSKLAREDPQCPLVKWEGRDRRQFFAENDSKVCKDKIKELISMARQALFWQWSKSQGDSSMLEMTEILAISSRSRELIAAR